MKHSFRDILKQVLEIIDYRDDREKFTDEFEETNRLEALAVMIGRLPEDAQRRLKEVNFNQEEVLKYINKEEFAKELSDVSSRALGEFLHKVTPMLSRLQKERVAQLLVNP